jgi:hypothetical protein
MVESDHNNEHVAKMPKSNSIPSFIDGPVTFFRGSLFFHLLIELD